nr:hypothetical protein [Mucilaginibacter sp. FT3.2]
MKYFSILLLVIDNVVFVFWIMVRFFVVYMRLTSVVGFFVV